MSIERFPGNQPELSDGHLLLRPWRESDADWVHATCQDPDIQRWTRIPVPYERADAVEWVCATAPGQWAVGEGAGFAVADASSGALLASCGVVVRDDDAGVAEAGYFVAPEARGRTVAARALRLLTAASFERWGLQRVELHIDPENDRSQAVAGRAGYVLEGVLRRRLRHRGELRDLAVYAALAGEWSVP